MSEDLLIKHCSPTLAGMKTGNLFCSNFENAAKMRECIRFWNRLLLQKGLRIVPLSFKDGRAMIYCYRPKLLSRDLQNCAATDILHSRGYSTEILEHCVVQLAKRTQKYDEFPHEIGLFLGYPPEDVCGFIENRAGGCKCSGCWKVYGDVATAEKLFAKYKKCTAVYKNCFNNGTDIKKLTVAV